MDSEKINLISELKEMREQISILNNMFINIKRYEKVAVLASRNIDLILYELTGDEFYNNGGKQ